MPNFSIDAHLLKWEPDVFRLCRFEHQKLAGGSGGATAAGQATLTDAAGDFVVAGVTTGHVVHLLKSGVYDDAFPVASRASATQLVLAAPRGVFSTQTAIAWTLHTFDPQHEEARFELMERFDLSDAEALLAREDEVFDVRVLRRASAFRVLEMVFRAQSTSGKDLMWDKAERYRDLYERALEAVKLRLDTDGDGNPDKTTEGASVDLVVDDAGDAWPK